MSDDAGTRGQARAVDADRQQVTRAVLRALARVALLGAVFAAGITLGVGPYLLAY